MTLGNFSRQAAAYEHSRPTYPAALIDELIADAEISPGDAVADFGAGTGILTQLLVDRGFTVAAIEPNASMRERARVLGAQWIDATFEESSLAVDSQRWAVAAQAFHWADPQRALPEIRRGLQPGRLFTVVWNNRANRENEVLEWTENAIRRHVPEFDEAYRNRPWHQILESTGDFIFFQHRAVRHTILMSAERYLELWRSHNRLNTIAGPQRFAALFAELSDYLQRRRIDQIDVLYNCESWSARRRD